MIEREAWHLSATDCQRWCGLSRSRFGALNIEPVKRSGRETLFDVRDVLRADGARRFSISGDGGAIDIDAERAGLVRAQRIGKELENAESENRLRPVEEVEEAILAALTPVVGMLDSLPLAIKRECPELSHTAIDRIERTIATARNQLADEDVMATPGVAA